MKVLITGTNGFIGKNLQLHLIERKDVQIVSLIRGDDLALLPDLLQGVDFVFHLAGVNRSKDPIDFEVGNVGLTLALSKALGNFEVETGNKIPVVYTSSIQADLINSYGLSKLSAENVLFELQRKHGVPVHIFRLPNVFGKWCKPNYNSVAATFCHNIARGLPIQVNDSTTKLKLVYIDDVVARFLELMDGSDSCQNESGFETISPQYSTTVGELASKIQAFKDSRDTLVTDRVGNGFTRALYATYLSYLPPELFAYKVQKHVDHRGVFIEMLKTPDCGQFSYFTAHPGITRGGHYHHSKTEKFLVIKGSALFRFRQMCTGDSYELKTSADRAEVVETVPGWTHDITNIGEDELVVMVWANEVFDRIRSDTFSCPV
jgi:UDP-2-acetamido-2,6-beta-L-arabino-hexul-4-ose reductase